MKGTIQICSLFNVPILVHWSFILLAAFVEIYGWWTNFGQTAFWMFCVLFACLFVFVICHELGHALMASRFNIKTEDIILLPVGGVARLRQLPEIPKQELLIALAGPLVNLCIGLIFLGACFLIDGEIGRIFSRRGYLIWEWSKLLPLLFYVNISLFVLNLIPVFPLDGGRVFRALLSFFMSREKATFLITRLGQWIGIGLIIYGGYKQELGWIIMGVFFFLGTVNAYRRFRME